MDLDRAGIGRLRLPGGPTDGARGSWQAPVELAAVLGTWDEVEP